MRIFCFGDSNTYGYDAASLIGGRLPEAERWPEILGTLSGWEVINEGMNGRKIPDSPWFYEQFSRMLSEYEPVDLVILMLGSNDLLGEFFPDAGKVGSRMERFLSYVLGHPAVAGDGAKVLLLTPPPMELGRFGEDGACYDEEAGKLGACYGEIAKRHGVRFADTSQWGRFLAHDGVHLTPQGHAQMAQRLWEMLREAPH